MSPKLFRVFFFCEELSFIQLLKCNATKIGPVILIYEETKADAVAESYFQVGGNTLALL
jgi:hypothetical protein